MALTSAFCQLTSLVVVSSVCLLIGLLGWRCAYKGLFERAQLWMPIISGIHIFILSSFYFGPNSLFHWLFVNIIAYSVVVFRSDQRLTKCLIVLASIVLFLICEFVNVEKAYLSPGRESLMIVFVFSFVSFYFAVVINLVMSRLKSVNSYLRVLAEKDELTGLSNRRKVLADAVNVFADSIINRLPCVFAIIDLDHFKKINDTYGHDVGDLVLAQVAEKMRSAVRPQDEIGRYGGEEFIVIMPNSNLKQAEVVIENLRKIVEEMTIETEQSLIIPVTVSAGLAAITSDVSRYEEILAQADKGLYQAKRNGRNRIYIQN